MTIAELVLALLGLLCLNIVVQGVLLYFAINKDNYYLDGEEDE